MKPELSYYGASKRLAPLFRLAYGHPFSKAPSRRVLILYEPTQISYSQVYPFLMYAEEFADRHDAQFRLLSSNAALRGLSLNHQSATDVLLQTWLTDSPDKLRTIKACLEKMPERPKLTYLDSFANSDIRLARELPEFSLYFKKSLFLNSHEYLITRYGHTNLSDFYGRLYNLNQEITDWRTPESFLPRLRLSPNFLTSPLLSKLFLGDGFPQPQNRRDIDLHARLGGTNREGWYGEMRRHAADAVAALDGVRYLAGDAARHEVFISEMHRSKIAFSPFGFGEICWRDIEAIATGAVLLKPDMSHLRTEPDLYRDGETYISCRWDFADLQEKVSSLLADETRRQYIADNAWRIARHFLEESGPVRSYAELFSSIIPAKAI